MAFLSIHRDFARRAAALLAALALPCLTPLGSHAQQAGTVAEMAGTVELVRGGTRIPVAIGTLVNAGDEIVTGSNGQALVVLDTTSVIVIGNGSRMRIDEQDATAARSRLFLSQGKARALVGERYGAADASYEIQTPTAIAAVHGTEFVVAYDPVAEVTDVVGIASTVRVQSLSDRAARGAVLVDPRELTTVAQAKLPSPPRYIPDERFRRYLEGLEFIGEGRPESLALAALRGQTVPSPDQAEAYRAPVWGGREPGTPPNEPNTPGDVGGEPPEKEFYTPNPGAVGVQF